MFKDTGGQVLLRTKSGYKPAQVFVKENDQTLVAKVGGYYIKLYSMGTALKDTGTTSSPSTTWEAPVGFNYTRNKVGSLTPHEAHNKQQKRPCSEQFR